MVGIDEDNKILGVSIIRQIETPGLWNKINEPADRKTFFEALLSNKPLYSKENEPWFQKQFVGIDLNKKITIQKNRLQAENTYNVHIVENTITAIITLPITTKRIVTGLNDSLIKLNKAKLIIDQKSENVNEQL
jgi:Na+-transporting NADH:ubiquinone oxidoreductase subunit NqrC